MGVLKKTNVRFCPQCGGPAISKKDGTPYSTCSRCDLSFKVGYQDAPAVPVVGGKAHQSECGSKVQHKTLRAAYNIGILLPDIPNRHRAKMVFYLCSWCDHWHIGHEGRRSGKSRLHYTLAQVEQVGIENIVDPLTIKIEKIENMSSQNPTTCSII